MSKRTLFLIFALFVITAVLLMLALYKPTPQQITEILTLPKEPVAQSVLSFGTPAIATSSSTSTINYSVPVNISTGKNKVTAVQLEMQYDPKVLSNVSASSSSFFDNPVVLLSETDTTTGRISYAFGIGPTGQGVVGLGTVATLNFSVTSSTEQQTTISFLPKTSLVTAEGINESVLKQTNDITLTVGKNPVPSQ